MARSIHANRSWRSFKQHGFHDWDAIGRKRRVKRGVAQARAQESRTPTSLGAEAIPSVVVDDSANALFFPASLDDFHAVLRALPTGATDGILSIRLEAGVRYVNELAPVSDQEDPLIGRRGEEIHPGVYAPSILGTYDPVSNDVRVFGFARAPDANVSPWQLHELRYSMLWTLVHEVAHHFDHTSRVARGRWLMDNREKAERYADATAMRWCREVVVPYLVERYGQPSRDAV